MKRTTIVKNSESDNMAGAIRKRHWFTITILIFVALTQSGCSDPGATFPTPLCKPGSECFTDEFSESGGSSGSGFDNPVSETQYVVLGNNVSAIVETKPFRLIVNDKQGQTVLASVDSDTPNYDPECWYFEPNTVGEFLSAPEVYGHFCERYHPLHFEIGEQEDFQFVDLAFIEPMRVKRDSTLYFATDVIGVEVQGSGLLITLATTRDNTTVDLLVEPDPTGVEAIRVMATVNDPQAQNISFAFSSNSEESFYGFGGRRTMDQRGKAIYSWTEDSMAQYSIFKKLSEHRAYGPQALFYSSENFGFLLENSELSRFHMGNDRDDAWKLNVSSNQATFVISSGNFKENIENITAINGRHLALPEWAKGLIFSHRSQISKPPKPGVYYAEALAHLHQLTDLDIETAGYLVEAWGSSAHISEEELNLLMAEIKSLGMKPLTYMREMVVQGFLGTENPEIFDQAVSQSLVPTYEDGSPYVYSMWLSPTSVIDYTNPQALAWWEQRVINMLDLGSEGFMLDFGEQVRPDMIFHNGETGRSMHNKLSTLAAKETARVVESYEQANPQADIFYFTRSNYTGRPGSPAFEHAQFLGDNTQSWDALTGIKAVVPDVLNRGLGGAFNVTTDIAGYWDLGRGVAGKELFIRWSQLAAFIPLMRLHNSPITALATPWSFDVETLQIFKSVLALRKKALPYMNTLSDIAADSGLPLLRPMWLEFPNDERFRDEAKQFMLGDKVLVAPVLDKGKRTKSVTLPEGCWQYMATQEIYEGGTTVVVEAPLTVLPYFFKCDIDAF
ncbi:MAG: hypothetical protein KUG82_15360 [Pseudomonadales bacterium]|nr:hypothetical protein [Pseudomonadales bacterium]